MTEGYGSGISIGLDCRESSETKRIRRAAGSEGLRSAETTIIAYVKKLVLTPATTEGPYYKGGSPEKAVLREEGVPGEHLLLTGRVLDTGGVPLARACLDFWQANGNGKYDNAGYVLRGHQFTDASGKYALETVAPGAYTGRTPHIHVKVTSPDGRSTLTTQLFVPGLASNKTDSIYRDDLLMKMSSAPAGKSATFDFVLGAS
jgi:protocatechuate 3,4-dioxygenase beta subunit